MKERDIVDIVMICENKRSSDCHDIDMTVVKKVVDGIAKPFTYIYN